jgi:Ca2+-transporting ATPase
MTEERRKMSTKTWFQLSIDDVFNLLQSSMNGISSSQAEQRLQEVGPNELAEAHKVSPWEILLQQFKNVLILILLIATAISFVLGHGIESLVIAIIVLFAVGLGFFQEYRAERAIEALRQMSAPTASVIRDGKEEVIPARELVPGDVILLHTGDRVPADSRIIESLNLQLEEAALTGESLPVEKHTQPIENVDIPIGDR